MLVNSIVTNISCSNTEIVTIAENGSSINIDYATSIFMCVFCRTAQPPCPSTLQLDREFNSNISNQNEHQNFDECCAG